MTFESDIRLQKRLAPLHLIAACLIAGVLAFTAVAWMLAPIGATAPMPLGATAPASGGGGLSMPMIMRVLWIVLALTQIPLAFVLRAALRNRAAVVRRADPTTASAVRGLAGDEAPVHQPSFQYFRIASLISLALLESVALIGVMALMFSAEAIDLVLIALPLTLMLGVFPTTGHWRSFDRAVQERATRAR